MSNKSSYYYTTRSRTDVLFFRITLFPDDKGADATDAPWTQRQSHVDDSSYDVPTSLVDSNGDLYKGNDYFQSRDKNSISSPSSMSL